MSSYNIYGYDPSTAGAIISSIIFAIIAAITLGLSIRYRTWFMLVIPIGATMEVIGFALRPSSSHSVGKYVITTLMILLSPTIFAMADYTMISRIMIKTGVHHPIFKPKIVRWIFLVADIISFFIQVSGGGLTANSDPNMAKMGARILLAGLAIVLVVFVFFLFMLIYLHREIRNQSLTKMKGFVVIYILYIDMIFLIIRSVYRVAEYGNMQHQNSISTNENLFYGLDALMMMLLSALWIPFHPGFWNLDKNEETKEVVKIVQVEKNNQIHRSGSVSLDQ